MLNAGYLTYFLERKNIKKTGGIFNLIQLICRKGFQARSLGSELTVGNNAGKEGEVSCSSQHQTRSLSLRRFPKHCIFRCRVSVVIHSRERTTSEIISNFAHAVPATPAASPRRGGGGRGQTTGGRGQDAGAEPGRACPRRAQARWRPAAPVKRAEGEECRAPVGPGGGGGERRGRCGERDAGGAMRSGAARPPRPAPFPGPHLTLAWL